MHTQVLHYIPNLKTPKFVANKVYVSHFLLMCKTHHFFFGEFSETAKAKQPSPPGLSFSFIIPHLKHFTQN